MLFGIDVRKQICRRYKEWNDFICIRTDLKCKLDDEENVLARDYITQAMELIDKVVDIKSFDMKEATDKFEKDFVSDIFENQDFYRLRSHIE